LSRNSARLLRLLKRYFIKRSSNGRNPFTCIVTVKLPAIYSLVCAEYGNHLSVLAVWFIGSRTIAIKVSPAKPDVINGFYIEEAIEFYNPITVR
jgi:hypothetical protein